MVRARRSSHVLLRALTTGLLAAALLIPSIASVGPGRSGLLSAAGADASAVLVRPEEGEVHRLYLAVLGRRPEADGFGYWVARRIEGVPLATVAESFLASTEFDVRFGATTDGDFLDLVYRNVLGRPGDAEGLAYWGQALGAGLTRSELVILFSESVEHRVATGTQPPALPAYSPVIRSVTDVDIGSSWRPGCPIGLADLRAVELDHVDPAGIHRRGTLIVHHDVVDDVVAIFADLYSARFPISTITPIARFDGDDDASMAAGNTSAFNCRPITGGTRWSVHAYGRAIDINPIENPYVASDIVLPPAGTSHLDRGGYHPAMIRPGDVVTRAFDRAGWRWGGRFRTIADYQHFER